MRMDFSAAFLKVRGLSTGLGSMVVNLAGLESRASRVYGDTVDGQNPA